VNANRVALELRALRELCACSGVPRLRAAVTQLRTHEWIDADRAVVFAAIRECVERDAKVTREAVIAMATRAGFPDIDCEQYFARGDEELGGAVEALLKCRD
jgi:hypothetical protein